MRLTYFIKGECASNANSLPTKAEALTRSQWEHLDVRRPRPHFLVPKGGEKAFDTPLLRPVLACLARRRRAGRFLHPGNETWIFPAASSSWHISKWKQPDELGREVGKTLRTTYATIAYEVTGGGGDGRVLLNHARTSVTSPIYQLRDLLSCISMDAEDISREMRNRLSFGGMQT